jgi:hypothetical protein
MWDSNRVEQVTRVQQVKQIEQVGQVEQVGLVGLLDRIPFRVASIGSMDELD